MTFKHVKFEDSATMRSLIKVAQEKGLLKEDPALTKTASAEKKIDYSPSSNLMENIIKLCTGLRDIGLDKFANELETKFMDYKKANSLYDTSKETGDDVVDQAHPQGSHKISDVEGDAVVETILDQHLKIVNIVNKKPTGKLASNHDILKAVKKVVAQQVDLKTSLNEIVKAAKTIEAKFNDVNWAERPRSSAMKALVNAATEAQANPSEDSLNYVSSLANQAMKDLKPNDYVGTLLGGVEEVIWKGMFPHFNNLLKYTANAVKELKNPTPPKADVNSINQFNTEFKRLNDLLSSWRAQIPVLNKSPEDKKEALIWVNRKLNEVKFVKDNFDKLDNDEQKLSSAEVFTSRLRGIENAQDADGSDDSFAGFKTWLNKGV